MNKLNQNRRCAIAFAAIVFGLIVVSVMSLVLGASSLTPGEAVRALLWGKGSARAVGIVRYVRLPRLLAALLAGSALAVSGLILQRVLMNHLAAPSVIGINAGAGLGALAAFVWFSNVPALRPVFAFCGALFTAFFVYALARVTGASRSSIILAGVATSSLLSACSDTLVTLFSDAGGTKILFSIGGFSEATQAQLRLAFPVIAAGFLLAAFLGRETEILSLGGDTARALGIRVERTRFFLIAAAAMLAGGAVSFAGLIGFVGLITPHAARRLTGGRCLLPVTALLGALLCALSDLAARTMFAPYEIPVGVVLSFLGAPFFLYLLLCGRRRGGHDAV